MSGTHRTYAPHSIGEHVLRLGLLGVVIGFGSLMFAAALLPPIGAAGRAVQRFADEFNQIGTDVDLHFPRIPERSTIYAADGSVLATLFLDENRKIVRLNQVPDLARDAVIAIEDDEFYEHPGLDFQGIIRALLANVRAGEIEQGASTITQQLARNVFSVIGKEDTLARKIQEARVAMRLEERYTKDQILELYLNEVYFGRGVYGIGTAAEYYFGKKPGKLILPEAAMLAGLISSPETYSPVNDPGAAMGRRNVVIDRMADLGMVGLEEANAAKATDLGLDITEVGNEDARFPFFVEYLKAQILDDPRFGPTRKARIKTLFQGGLKIYTTLDPALQRAGEAIVRNHLPAPSDPEGAMASVDVRTGAVKALVASTEFEDSQVNLATGQGGTGRQSGSAFKPFTLVAALEQGIPVGKVYKAASGQYVDCGAYGGRYQVFNAGDGGGTGFVDLRTATAGSINAVFVQLAVDAGVPNVVDAAHRMGIDSPLPPYCSVTLGTAEVTPLEMASAFSTLARDGVHCEPFAITSVETRTGKQVLSQKRGACEEVVDPDVANDVAGLLGLVVDQGTGTAAALGNWDVFGKTGTTNDSADVWFSGCTRQICAATWVGHPEARVPMPGAYGGTVAAPIWHDFMLRAMQGLASQPLPAAPVPEQAQVPSVVGATEKDAVDALVDANFTPIVTSVPGVEPAGTVVSQSPGGGATVTAGSRVTISVSDGKVAEAQVPNVVGLDRTTAAGTLRQAGFRVNVDIAITDQQQFDGIVTAQTPEPGTSVAEGATVTIAVADYKKPKPPPGGTPPDGT
ncbi:MAG: transglycosylase domain-containing protein [Actinomycetota bacterium]